MGFQKLALTVVSLAVSLTSLPRVIQAAPIYIDFGDRRGSASQLVDGTPVTWNVVPTVNPFAPLNLADSDGGNTGIQLSAMTGFDTSYDDGLTGGEWNMSRIPWSVGEATHDNFAANSSAVVTFSNLESKPYRVELISSRDSGTSRNTVYRANGDLADLGGVNGSNPFNANTDGWLNRSIMVWQQVMPDLGSEIHIDLAPQSGQWGYVNAIRLQDVPEPSTLLLFSLGGLIAVIVARRRITARA